MLPLLGPYIWACRQLLVRRFKKGGGRDLIRLMRSLLIAANGQPANKEKGQSKDSENLTYLERAPTSVPLPLGRRTCCKQVGP